MSQRMPPYCSGFQNQSGRPEPPPASPPRLKDLVRRNIDGLNHLADGALLDQFAGVNGGLHLQQLAVHDGVDPLGLGDGLAHFGQLLERGDAGLVGEIVLAVLHGADAERARSLAICELSTSCIEGSLRISSCVSTIFTLGKRFLKAASLVFFAAPGRHQLAAAALDRADHAVDVVVAHAADAQT